MRCVWLCGVLLVSCQAFEYLTVAQLKQECFPTAMGVRYNCSTRDFGDFVLYGRLTHIRILFAHGFQLPKIKCSNFGAESRVVIGECGADFEAVMGLLMSCRKRVECLETSPAAGLSAVYVGLASGLGALGLLGLAVSLGLFLKLHRLRQAAAPPSLLPLLQNTQPEELTLEAAGEEDIEAGWDVYGPKYKVDSTVAVRPDLALGEVTGEILLHSLVPLRASSPTPL